VLGAYQGEPFEVSPLAVQRWVWGDFKRSGQGEIEIARLELADGRAIDAAYETGSASMAPICYERFWRVKYPNLDKFAV
jgi:hypothetical protein